MTCASSKRTPEHQLSVLLKRAADLADIPLTCTQADSLRRELVKSLPDLLDLIAGMAEGKAT